MYFIQEGCIVFKIHDISFTKILEGTYFGEIEILLNTYREYSAETFSNTTCFVLEKNLLMNDIFNEHHDFFYELVENMEIKYRLFNKKVKLIGCFLRRNTN